MRAGSIDVIEPPAPFTTEGLVQSKIFYYTYYYSTYLIYDVTEAALLNFFKIKFSLLITEFMFLKIVVKILYLFLLLGILKKTYNNKIYLYLQFKNFKSFKVNALSRSNLSNLMNHQKAKQIFTKGILYF